MKWRNEAMVTKGATMRSVEALRRKHLKSAEVLYRKALREQVAEVQKKLRQVETVEGMLPIAESIVVDSMPIKKAMESVYVGVGGDFARTTYSNLTANTSKKSRSEDYFDDYMRRYVEEKTGDRIKTISETTREKMLQIVKSTVGKALSEGLSVDEIRDILQQKFANMVDYRAVRIARTEVISASNAGSLQGAISTGIAFKKVWLATKTGHTRKGHLEMMDKSVGVMEQFSVPIYDTKGAYLGSEKLNFPADPNGSAGNVINCRCTLVYEPIK